ncbi:MAG TPA: SGNH/GDSL hydrolase family protein [Candidatus Methylacidiphilales bacterium]
MALLYFLPVCLPLRLAAADAPAVAPPVTSEFLFRDTPNPVLFIGDDATAQRMFSTLIETYTLSRFPAWKITFRNTGWEGDKILSVGTRGYSRDQDIRRDIESFRPQLAIVNYGMNDARGGDASYENFLTNMNILSRDLPRVGVYRAAFVTANPEEGYAADVPAGSSYNLMLQKYAEGMKERFPLGWKDGVESVQRHPKGPELPQLQNAIFIDLLNPMIDLIAAGRKAGILSPDASAGQKTARLMPDGVHPNWSGHFIMATLVLQGLHAPDLVSSAILDAASHSTLSAQGCTITWQDAGPGVVQFERTDVALPWPTPPNVDLALKIPGFDPATKLNRYDLKISGLKEPFYQLGIDDQIIGVYSQSDLANGVNLGFLRRGPLYDQGQKLLKAVLDKNDTFFNRWRTVEIGPPSTQMTNAPDIRKAEAAHLDEVKLELARLDKVIADEEQAIHLLSQPVPHVFKLEPVVH